MTGALCAWDGVPRWWSEGDVELLVRLATGVDAILDGLAAAPAGDVAPGRSTGVAEAAAAHAHALALAEAEQQREALALGAMATALLEEVPDGLLLLDEDWHIRWASQRAARCFGMPLASMQGADARQLLTDVIDPAVASAWQRAMAQRQPVSFAWHHPPTDRWFEGHASRGTMGLAIAVRDVTVSHRAEREREASAGQRRDAETLEAVALLAGGVAHDFNNLLTVIAANAEMLQQSVAGDADTEVAEIHRATARATRLTQLLLACGRQLALAPELAPLNTLVGAMEPAVRALLPDGVRFETSLTRQDSRVLVDPAQLEQVTLHLVRERPRRDGRQGGVLRVTTEIRELRAPLPARPRPYRRALGGAAVRDIGRRGRSAASRSPVRAVLHDAGRRCRSRTRPGGRLRHHRAVRRRTHGGERGGTWQHVSRVAAGRARARTPAPRDRDASPRSRSASSVRRAPRRTVRASACSVNGFSSSVMPGFEHAVVHDRVLGVARHVQHPDLRAHARAAAPRRARPFARGITTSVSSRSMAPAKSAATRSACSPSSASSTR